MKKKSAFTLIEVLVVVSIIALISSVVFFSLSSSRQEERDAKKIADVLQLQTALENYKRAEGVYPSTITLGQPLVGSTTGVTFLSKVPVAPTGETCAVSQYSYSYSTTTKEYSFSFCINNDLEDYRKGVHYATPRGIEKAPPVCGDPDYVLTDAGGNTYPTILIGAQCWMAKNLDYDNGCALNTWVSGTDTGWCGCYNDDPGNCVTYGRLYQWSAAMNGSTTEGAQGLCPSGWHIPTYDDLSTLGAVTGGKLKQAGTSTWFSPNTGATNESGFTALSSGERYSGGYGGVGYVASFWSSLLSDPYAVFFYMLYNSADFQVNCADPDSGYSVRCIKN